MKKIVLITGASSGIGKATAEKLLEEGYTVYAAARGVDKMADLKKKGAHLLKMDVTNENELKKGINKIIKDQKRIDVLFNNAGYGLYGSVEDTPIEDTRKQFEVNMFGLARLTQLVLPHMRKQKSGLIINTSSMGGKIYTPLGAWYHATKHAVEGWSDCLRIELKQFGINVVVVEPGGIETPWGSIAADHIERIAKGGAYEKFSKKVADSTRSRYETPGALSPPSVIAEVVSEAISSDYPKTRYVAGKFAKSMMFIRKWLGDRVFDRLLLSQIK